MSRLGPFNGPRTVAIVDELKMLATANAHPDTQAGEHALQKARLRLGNDAVKNLPVEIENRMSELEILLEPVLKDY